MHLILSVVLVIAGVVNLQAAEPLPALEETAVFDLGADVWPWGISGMERGPEGSFYMWGIAYAGDSSVETAFVIKTDGNGQKLWHYLFSTVQGNFPGGIAVNGDGNAYLAVTDLGTEEPMVVKLDPSGSVIQTQVLPVTDPGLNPMASGVAFDRNLERLYVSQEFYNDPISRTSTLVAAYDSDLNLLGSVVSPYVGLGDLLSFTFYGNALSLDNVGNVYVGGMDWLSYIALKYTPELSLTWSATQEIVPLEGIFFMSRGYPGGGVAFAGLELDDPVTPTAAVHLLKRVDGSGVFQAPVTVPLEMIFPAMGTDGRGNTYVGGYVLESGYSAVVKFDAEGGAAWEPPVLENRDVFFGSSFLADEAQNKLYVGGIHQYLADRGTFFLARYGQAAPPSEAMSVKITLDPPSVLPGTATQVVVEVVNASGDPVSGANVTLTAEPVANSGGHDHDTDRPVGAFSGPGIIVMSPAHGTTGPDGKLFAVFTSTHFGGLETIHAHLTATPAISTSAALEVRVPGLVLLPDAATYVKIGGTCNHHGPSDRPSVPSSCRSPDNNHWGAPDVIQVLQLIASDYLLKYPSRAMVKFNDISLQFGGAFDMNGNWKRPHRTHDKGKSVDVRSNPGNSDGVPTSDDNLKQFKVLTKERYPKAKVSIHSQGDANEHIHIDF